VLVASLVSSATAQTVGAASLTWNIKEGSAYDLTINTDLGLNAPQSMWDELDRWLAEDLGVTEVTVSDLWDLFQSMLPSGVITRFTISDIYGETDEYSPDMDVVEATLTVKDSDLSSFVTPGQYVNKTLDEVLPTYYSMMLEMMGSESAPPYAEFAAMIKADATEGMETNDPVEIARWQPDPLAPEAAQSMPFDMSDVILALPDSPTSLIVLPAEWNFKTIYDTVVAEMNSLMASASMTVDVQDVIAAAGLSTLVVEARAIAIGFDLADVDYDFLDEITGGYGTMIQQQIAGLAAMGIDINSATAGIGMEWAASGFLSAVGMYITADVDIDSSLMMGPMAAQYSSPPLPNIDATITMNVGQTAAAPGVTPPTLDQINNGQIGEDRPGAVPEGDDAPAVPGYSVAIVSLMCLVTTVVLIKKRRS
jgi:hypothetical protein